VRIALVVNARSGGGLETDEVAELLRARGAQVEAFDLEALKGGDARLGQAVAAADRLVVAGGDGTIGLGADAARAGGAVLAVLPAGTANDFARHAGLPTDLEEAVALAADPTARARPFDLHRADDRPFLNAASSGLSAEAADRAAPLKPALGAAAYAAGAVAAGATGDPEPCRVVVDGTERFDGDVWQVIVAGTGAFGGGSELDAADPRDGLLDVAVVEAGPRAALVLRAWGMRAGSLTDQEGVVHLRGAEVRVIGPDAWNVDGERCTLGPDAHFRSDGRVDVLVGS
jgi:diacylglycerol kinase family enzyme